MANDELQRLSRQLRRMYSGHAWHGPSVSESLEGVTAAQAAARPIAGAHTIYELAHHIEAWAGEVTRRLGGAAPALPQEGDWPAADVVVDEARWNAALALLAARHATLEEAILAADPTRLDDRVGSDSGSSTTVYAMLHGIVEHDAYHAGQIVLVRRALESGPRQ